MASSFHFYEDIFKQLNNALTSYVSDVASNVISAITPVATSLLTLYVILWGWAMARGTIQEPIMDGAQRVVRLSLITGIALSVGNYNKYLSDFLWQSPEALASIVVSGSSGGSNTQFLDSLMSQIYDLGDAFWKAGNAPTIPDLGTVVVGILIWAVGIVATAYGAFLLALSKIALALLLGAGPIFVLMLIFEATKKFFDAWIGQACNYIFLVMLTAGAIKIILTVVSTYMTQAGAVVAADPKLPAALPAIVVCIIAALVMMQLPSIASALGGGVAVGTLGAAGWAYRKATGAASAIRPTNARRSAMRIRSDLRIAKGAAKAVGGAPMAAYRKITGQKNSVSKG